MQGIGFESFAAQARSSASHVASRGQLAAIPTGDTVTQPQRACPRSDERRDSVSVETGSHSCQRLYGVARATTVSTKNACHPEEG